MRKLREKISDQKIQISTITKVQLLQAVSIILCPICMLNNRLRLNLYTKHDRMDNKILKLYEIVMRLSLILLFQYVIFLDFYLLCKMATYLKKNVRFRGSRCLRSNCETGRAGRRLHQSRARRAAGPLPTPWLPCTARPSISPCRSPA